MLAWKVKFSRFLLLLKFSKEIEDIQIDPNNSIKITQYANDTTVFVDDIQSVQRLFDLLQQFENWTVLVSK